MFNQVEFKQFVYLYLIIVTFNLLIKLQAKLSKHKLYLLIFSQIHTILDETSINFLVLKSLNLPIF